VVDVAVGQQQLFELDAQAGGRGDQSLNVAAGVDQRALHGLGAPEQAAILFEGSDGDDAIVEAHGKGIRS
jgi:hypothetical protein